MSNVKDVFIEANVPWNWWEGLKGEDVARFGSIVLNPVNGIEIDYDLSSPWVVPNPDGSNGQTTMYRMVIAGQEAYAWVFLESLAKALETCPGVELLYARARDIEDGLGSWTEILAAAAA